MVYFVWTAWETGVAFFAFVLVIFMFYGLVCSCVLSCYHNIALYLSCLLLLGYLHSFGRAVRCTPDNPSKMSVYSPLEHQVMAGLRSPSVITY